MTVLTRVIGSVAILATAASCTNYFEVPVETPLQEGLITTDNETIYRIDDNIPVMLVDQGIPGHFANQG